LIRCANCRRRPRADENADDEWRVYSDGVGELLVFCPECAEREFTPDVTGHDEKALSVQHSLPRWPRLQPGIPR
jgi:hypothetical protein